MSVIIDLTFVGMQMQIHFRCVCVCVEAIEQSNINVVILKS